MRSQQKSNLFNVSSNIRKESLDQCLREKWRLWQV